MSGKVNMNVKPFISICIPAYERANHLRRLLNSIAGQSYHNFEVIVSDDSKSNVVKELADQFEGKFRIAYSKNIPSAGVPGNWNISMQKANGYWIKMMHDDDWFSTSKALEQFAIAAETSSFNFIFSACNNIYLDTGKERHELLEGIRKEILEDSVMNLFYQNLIGHPSTVMHKYDSSILFDTRYKWVVDIDFYMRFILKHNGYEYLPNMLISIGTDDSQVTNECNNNPYIELPEYVSLLAKFPPGTLLKHPLMFENMWHLLKKYKVRKVSDLREFGYKDEIPQEVLSIIKFQASVPALILKQPPWAKKLRKLLYKRLSDKPNRT